MATISNAPHQKMPLVDLVAAQASVKGVAKPMAAPSSGHDSDATIASIASAKKVAKPKTVSGRSHDYDQETESVIRVRVVKPKSAPNPPSDSDAKIRIVASAKKVAKPKAVPKQNPPSQVNPQTDPPLNVEELLKHKLANPKLVLKPAESIALLQHCIQLGMHEAQKVNGKEIIVFIGNTGAGKSTLIDYLSGCTMQRKNPQDLGLHGPNKVVVVKPVAEGGKKDEVMKIGHSNRSMTFMPQIESNPQGYIYCDCPGFLDNRGTEINVSNAVNIKNIIGKASSVKIVILINYYSSIADRGKGLQDTLKMCCSLFGSSENLIKFKNSLLLGITQTPFKEIEDEESVSNDLTVEDLKKWLTSQDSTNDSDKTLLQELSEQIFIYDPLDSKNLKYKGALKRDDLLNALTHLEPIPNPLKKFKAVLTPEDLQGLAHIAEEIKVAVAEILKKEKLTIENFKQLASYQQSLNQLDIIEHPHVIGLTNDSRQLITVFFQKLVHQFDLNCKDVNNDLSAQSNAILTTIREGVQYFDAQVKASVDMQSLEKQYALLLLTLTARKENYAWVI